MSGFRRVMNRMNRPFDLNRARRPSSASTNRSRGTYSNIDAETRRSVAPSGRQHVEFENVRDRQLDVVDRSALELCPKALQHGRGEIEPVEAPWREPASGERLAQRESDGTASAAGVEYAKISRKTGECRKKARSPWGYRIERMNRS
jgi:hypothetical protein